MTDNEKPQSEILLPFKVVPFTPDESNRIGTAIIAAAGENSAQFGKKLIDMARSREETVFMETVLNRAKELVSHLNNLYLADEKLQKEIALFLKRIEAVQAGEFKVGTDGRLLYNDILLNY